MLAVSAWMTSQRSTSRLTRAGLLTFLTCCSSQFTQAEDPASLQSRLEQIESQNEQLRQELSELRKRDELLATQISNIAPCPASPSAESPTAAVKSVKRKAASGAASIGKALEIVRSMDAVSESDAINLQALDELFSDLLGGF